MYTEFDGVMIMAYQQFRIFARWRECQYFDHDDLHYGGLHLYMASIVTAICLHLKQSQTHYQVNLDILTW